MMCIPAYSDSKNKRDIFDMKRHPGLWSIVLAVFGYVLLGVPQYSFAASLSNIDQFTRGWQAYESERYDEAFTLWNELARGGDVRAQVNLGTMYDSGSGVAENPVLAAKWYRMAAEQGNCGAQYNLAVMYATGRGVPLDAAASAAWYRKAAEQGFSVAQYDLGMLYASGAGVPKDNEISIQWLYKAGISYLEENNREGVLTAVDAINKLVPDHGLADSLREKICSSGIARDEYSVPEIFDNSSIGTAWPIASGYVVTCNHVVSAVETVTLVTVSGLEIPAQVVSRDETNDVALLQVEERENLPAALPLAGSHARLGAEVFTIGFPRLDVMGRKPKLSVGIISGEDGLYDDPASYQTTLPIQPGNSGGPVMNMKGEVVGIAASMLGVRDAASGNISMLPNISCVTKVDTLQRLLKSVPENEPVIKELTRRSEDLENLAERIHDSVLIVVAR